MSLCSLWYAGLKCAPFWVCRTNKTDGVEMLACIISLCIMMMSSPNWKWEEFNYLDVLFCVIILCFCAICVSYKLLYNRAEHEESEEDLTLQTIRLPSNRKGQQWHRWALLACFGMRLLTIHIISHWDFEILIHNSKLWWINGVFEWNSFTSCVFHT